MAAQSPGSVKPAVQLPYAFGRYQADMHGPGSAAGVRILVWLAEPDDV